METLLSLFGFFSPVIMIIGIMVKFLKISKMPVSIRWEIYPNPTSKASYFENVDWFKKKQEKNILGEFIEPFKELFSLHRLKKFNTYGLWPWSMALHWGIWLIFLWIFLILAVLIMDNFSLSNFTFVAYLSYILGIIGCIGLIIKRISNNELKLYTSGIDYFNLLFFFTLFGTGLLMIV